MNECLLCDGHGYVTILMGGTETCLHCQGTGIKEVEEAETAYSRQ